MNRSSFLAAVILLILLSVGGYFALVKNTDEAQLTDEEFLEDIAEVQITPDESTMPAAVDAPPVSDAAAPAETPAEKTVANAVAEQESVMPSPQDSPLQNILWIPVQMNGNPVAAPVPNHEPFVTFLTEGNKLEAYGGCNRFRGTYNMEGQNLSVPDELMGTRMACDQLPTEHALLLVLDSVKSWSMDQDMLVFHNAGGAVLARFRPDIK